MRTEHNILKHTNTENSKALLHWSFYFPHFQMIGTWITLFTVQKLFGARTYRLPLATESLSQTQIHCSHLNSTEQASWLNPFAMLFEAKYWYEGEKLSIKADKPSNKPHLCTKYTTWIVSTHLHTNTQMYSFVNRIDMLLRSSEMNSCPRHCRVT